MPGDKPVVRAHVVIGIIGGAIGLLMTPLNFILSIVVLVFTGGQGPQLIILTGVGALAAIAGIIGAIVSRSHIKLGGVIMLASGATPLLLAAAIALSLNIVKVMLPLLILYFWTFILLLAGAMSLVRRGPEPVNPIVSQPHP